MSDGPVLSQAVLSDLVTWHSHLAAGGEAALDPRIVVARCIEALADVRLGALTILDAAIELHEEGEAAVALMLLKSAAERYRDICPERRAN